MDFTTQSKFSRYQDVIFYLFGPTDCSQCNKNQCHKAVFLSESECTSVMFQFVSPMEQLWACCNGRDQRVWVMAGCGMYAQRDIDLVCDKRDWTVPHSSWQKRLKCTSYCSLIMGRLVPLVVSPLFLLPTPFIPLLPLPPSNLLLPLSSDPPSNTPKLLVSIYGEM